MYDNASLSEIRKALEIGYHKAFALDDETINAAIMGQPTDVPQSDFEVSIDIQPIVTAIILYSPIIASAIGIIKGSYSLYEKIQKDKAVTEIYEILKANKAVDVNNVDESTAKRLIAASLSSIIINTSKDKN